MEELATRPVGLKRKLEQDASPSAVHVHDFKSRLVCLSPTQLAAVNQPIDTPQKSSGVRLVIRAPKPSSEVGGSCCPSPAVHPAITSTMMPQRDEAEDCSDAADNVTLHPEAQEPCTPRASSCGSSIFTPERLQQQQQLRSWSASAASRSLFMAQLNSSKFAPSSCDRASTPTSKKDLPRWMSPPTSIIHRLQAMTPPQRHMDTVAAHSLSSLYPATPNKSQNTHPGSLGSLDPVAALQQWLQLQVSSSNATLGKQRIQLPAACHEAARQASMHRML